MSTAQRTFKQPVGHSRPYLSYTPFTIETLAPGTKDKWIPCPKWRPGPSFLEERDEAYAHHYLVPISSPIRVPLAPGLSRGRLYYTEYMAAFTGQYLTFPIYEISHPKDISWIRITWLSVIRSSTMSFVQQEVRYFNKNKNLPMYYRVLEQIHYARLLRSYSRNSPKSGNKTSTVATEGRGVRVNSSRRHHRSSSS